MQWVENTGVCPNIGDDCVVAVKHEDGLVRVLDFPQGQDWKGKNTLNEITEYMIIK